MYFKYKMSKTMALEILNKNKNKKLDKQKVLCDYINEQNIFKGTCIEVIY